MFVLIGLVAGPLLAALTLWYAGVAVAHARIAQRCGKWLALAGLFGLMSIAFIVSTACAIYVGRVEYGWINQTPVGPWGAILVLVGVYLFVWVLAFIAGTRLTKRRDTFMGHLCPVHGPEAQEVQEDKPDPQGNDVSSSDLVRA